MQRTRYAFALRARGMRQRLRDAAWEDYVAARGWLRRLWAYVRFQLADARLADAEHRVRRERLRLEACSFVRRARS